MSNHAPSYAALLYTFAVNHLNFTWEGRAARFDCNWRAMVPVFPVVKVDHTLSIG